MTTKTSIDYSNDQKSIRLVTFNIDRNLYGIDVSVIQEVIRHTTITASPGAWGIVEGIIDLRGNIIPIVDLRKRFTLPVTDNNGRKIIITEIRDFIFGLIVDKVHEVHSFNLGCFSPPPLGICQPGNEYTIGVTKYSDQLLFFLDVEKIIDIEQLLQDHQ